MIFYDFVFKVLFTKCYENIIRGIKYIFGNIFLKKNCIFIAILTALLLFQSVWNIAAAFCVHENTREVASTPHFGHHQVLSSCQQSPDSAAKISHDSTHAQKDMEDHADHLPSFTQIALLEHQSDPLRAEQFIVPARQNYVWQNFYQSPDLTGQNPPPLLSPL